jgi:ABC-type polysaccharide/polyol phosphate transport system ATPase subunit
MMRLFTNASSRGNLGINEFWALQNVSFEVFGGEIIAIVGPNGAGKSTILRLVANLKYPYSGHIKVQGTVAPIIELGTGFHPDLSGYENIFVNGVILGMSIKAIKQKIKSIIDFSGVEEFIHMPVKYYSSGMYVRLAFSIAVESDADIYLFDEVITVGDSEFQEKCAQKILGLKDQGKTIVFVRHDERLIEKLGARVIHIKKGELV